MILHFISNKIEGKVQVGIFKVLYLMAFAVCLSIFLPTNNAMAGGVGSDSDGWITPHVGHPLFITYLSNDSSTESYSDGDRISDNANLDANVTVLRYVHPVDIGHGITMTPNVLLPIVNIETGGDLDGLGDTTDLGDLLLVCGVWPIHNWEARKHLAIVPYLWLPTGKYDKDDPLNIGENRYKAALQLGGQFPIYGRWDFSGSMDTTFFWENTDIHLKQDPLTRIDAWLKYNLESKAFAHVAVGVTQLLGGETEIDGISQNDELNTTTIKAQFGTLNDDSQTRHVLFTVGQDVNVENGLKTDWHFELRFTQVF